jgi:dolichol kinase
MWLFTSIALIFVIGWILMTGLVNAYKCRVNPELKEEKSYNVFREQFLATWKYDFKKDVERKILHLLPVAVIFIVWTLGTILDNMGVLARWGLDNYSFSMWIIVTVGVVFVFFFAVGDLIRLNYFYCYPNWGVKWLAKSMHEDELDTFVSSAPMVLAFIPFVFAPFPLFAAIALITAGADAAASLVGKRYGKHKFREKSKKTIEGYIAGAGMTFIFVLLISGIYYPLLGVSIVVIMTMAIVACACFFLVDAVLSDTVSDNILNPVICGFGMWWVFLFL